MERNVISLETAKRLKTAGFPQMTAYGWNYSSDVPAAAPEMSGRTYYLAEGTDFGAIAAPTAQEIADELPEKGYEIRAVMGGFWGYIRANQQSIKLTTLTATTLAETFAQLWLKLKEEDQ